MHLSCGGMDKGKMLPPGLATCSRQESLFLGHESGVIWLQALKG